MSVIACQIHSTSKSQTNVYASAALLRSLGLRPGQSIRLHFGKAETDAVIRRVQTAGQHLYIPGSIRTKLKLPVKKQMLLAQDGSDVHIGPAIGILTTLHGSSANPFGTRTGLIRQFMAHGSKKGICYAFSPGSIDWPSRTCIGWLSTSGGGWSRRRLPLPDVVYNRMPSRAAEKSASLSQIKERMTASGIPVFNWSFFEKWDVYRLLENDSSAFQHVPESVLGPSQQELKRMMEEHALVYLKPTGGSLGKGIYRLTYKKGNGYFARFRSGGRNVLLRFNRFATLAKRLGIHTGRMRNYVAQQGIRLVEIDGSPIDFRFHLNKDQSGKWVVAGIGCKKAGKGSVTTHVRTGGSLLTPEYALGRIYSSSKANELLNTAKSVSLKLAESIERHYPHTIGELGFDLGIDQNDKVWMFEANSKPGRSIYKHPALKNEGLATMRHLFDYCAYLGGFREEEA